MTNKNSAEKNHLMALKVQPLLHELVLLYPEDEPLLAAQQKVAEAIKGLQVQAVVSQMEVNCKKVTELMEAETVDMDTMDGVLQSLVEQLGTIKNSLVILEPQLAKSMAKAWDDLVGLLAEIVFEEEEIKTEQQMVQKILDAMATLPKVVVGQGVGTLELVSTFSVGVEMQSKLHALKPSEDMEVDKIMEQEGVVEKMTNLRRCLLKLLVEKDKKLETEPETRVKKAMNSMEIARVKAVELLEKLYKQMEMEAKKDMQDKLKALLNVGGGKKGGLKWDENLDKNMGWKALSEAFLQGTLLDVEPILLQSALLDMEQAKHLERTEGQKKLAFPLSVPGIAL